MGRKRDSGLNDNLESLEKRIEQCRVLYELWFNGVEKREPTWHRQEILRQLTRLRRNAREIKSAVDRFRMRNIQARFNALTQYWNRIILQRERGTYHKDLARMKRRMGDSASPGSTAPKEVDPKKDAAPRAHSLDVGDLGGADLTQSLAEAAEQAASSQAVSAASGAASRREPGVTAGPAVPPTSGDSLSDQRMQQIYRTFIKARERTDESTNVSFDSVSRSLQSQLPRLREKGYDNVDFKVVIKDGKAAIKPVAKK